MKSPPHATAVHLQPVSVFLVGDPGKTRFSIGCVGKHSKAVATWLEEHKEQIELFFLPPYAPEYNPDELLNSDLKRNAGAMQSPRSQLELENNVRSRLNFLISSPHLISSFFHAPLTSYAA